MKKSKMMKKLSVIAILMALVMVVVACGNNGAAPDTVDADDGAAVEVTDDDGDAEAGDDPAPVADGEQIVLTMVHHFTPEEAEVSLEATAFRNLKYEFLEENPHITINETTMGHDDMQVTLLANAAANDLPDVFFMKGSWTENWVESGLVADITDDIRASAVYDDLFDGVLNTATFNGRTYGFPIQGQNTTSIVYYNAELWAEAGFDTFPDNWEDVIAASEFFNEQGIATIALGNQDRWPWGSCWFSVMGYQFAGSDWFDSIVARDGVASFTDQGFIDALAWTAMIGQSGVLNSDFNTITTQQASDVFGHWGAATLVGGFWELPALEATADEGVLENMRLTLLPAEPTAAFGDVNIASATAGWNMSINSNLEGAQRQAAIDFIFATFGNPAFSIFTSENGMAGPINVGEVDMSGLTPLQEQYVGLANRWRAVPVWDAILSGAIIEVKNTGIQDILDGVMAPEDLAAELQAIQESLED